MIQRSLALIIGCLLLIQRASAQDQFLCNAECKMEIVETIPEGMESSDRGHISTHAAWLELINLAQENIHIASYYWTLRDEAFPPHETSMQGSEILDKLIEAGSRTENNISILITKHVDERNFPNLDIKELLDANAALVRDVNVTRLIGSGILHTKMWIVDGKHLYLGSANLDWRALTQVKELGILVKDCPCLANDMDKTFEVYWEMGTDTAIAPERPEDWDPAFESPYNMENQLNLTSDGIQYDTFVTSAPPRFCPRGRTGDLDGITQIMEDAQEFIHIAVMDYFPLIMFNGPLQYWGDLDNILRNAALRNVKVKLLMAKWSNTRASAQMFLRSLESMNKAYANVDIQVKMFEVPATPDQETIPYARVNHNKYVVTEKATHIGTSNWSGDYFLSTGGVGLVITPTNNGTASSPDIRQQVEDIFMRDWESPYAKTIDEIYPPEKEPPTVCNNKAVSIQTSILTWFLVSAFLTSVF